MTVSEYIIAHLTRYGVRHIFMITGGAAMYLNDAVINQKKITYICNHHEQASAMAAECYARIVGDIGVVMVTSGAAAMNAISGVLGAWQDSIPMLVLSGNVKRELLGYNYPNLRELGIQDTRVVDIVRPITKYATVLQNASDVAQELEKAIHRAVTPRQGPVWMDIPLDIQGTQIQENALLHFSAPKKNTADITSAVKETLKRIRGSEYPVIIVGSGIRSSGSYELFHRVLDTLKIPVLTSLTGHDVMYETHPLYAGRFGPYGNPRGNEAIKRADVLLILGSRMQVWQMGYDYKDFAKHAYKIMVDIDPAEFSKPTLPIDLPIYADMAYFLKTMERLL